MKASLTLLTVCALAACATTTTASAPAATVPATAPTLPPPAPPATVAALPASLAAGATDGQWVSTAQYGWVWMPYKSDCTYLPADTGAMPLMYVYVPATGWEWVVAPWVWGLGPRPWFAAGPERFVWYGRAWAGHPWYGFRGGTWHGPVHFSRHG